MKISIVGAGAMGGALAGGLLENGAGAYEISVSNPSHNALEPLEAKGATVFSDNVRCVESSDIVVLAVKPWIVPDVIREIKSVLDYSRQTMVVIAASVSGADLRSWFEKDGVLPPIIIGMPNTAMAVEKSMTFLTPVTAEADKAHVAPVVAMFNCLGSVMAVDEARLPAAMALASCGIAYAMRYVRAAVEGGVELGLKADMAQEIVVHTLEGACALLSRKGAHPESEIDKVTTPGGLTIKGLNEMEHAGFSSAVIRGLKACVK